MKQRVLAVVAMAFLLINSPSVLAEGEGDSHTTHTTETSTEKESINQSQGNKEGTDASQSSEGELQHEEGGNGGEESHSTETSEQGTETESSHSSEESEHGEEGGHGSEEITESAPNYRVLTVFGLINLTFILIGVWNKLIKGRGKKNVYAK
jgi:cobalamin biosynthesis Mg chelatase CobN